MPRPARHQDLQPEVVKHEHRLPRRRSSQQSAGPAADYCVGHGFAERQHHIYASQQNAIEQEFLRNRQAAAETKRRAEMEQSPLELHRGGGPNVVRRHSSESALSDSERRKAEVRRRGQEQRDEVAAARHRELERAMREAAEDRRMLQQRMLDVHAETQAELPPSDVDEANSGAPPARTPATREEVRQRAQEERDEMAAARHRELERAMREAAEDRRMLQQRMLDLQAQTQEELEPGDINNANTSSLPDRTSAARLETDEMPRSEFSRCEQAGGQRRVHHDANQHDVYTFSAPPCEAPPSAGGHESASDLAEDQNLEFVISFTEKVRPKPKLSSEGRPPRRSRGASAEPTSSAGGSSASPGPSVAHKLRSRSLSSSAADALATGAPREGEGSVFEARRGGRSGPQRDASPSVGGSVATPSTNGDNQQEAAATPKGGRSAEAVATPKGGRSAVARRPPRLPSSGPGRPPPRAAGSPARWLRDAGVSADEEASSPLSGRGGAWSSGSAALPTDSDGCAARSQDVPPQLPLCIETASPPVPRCEHGDVALLQDALANALCGVSGQRSPSGLDFSMIPEEAVIESLRSWRETASAPAAAEGAG